MTSSIKMEIAIIYRDLLIIVSSFILLIIFYFLRNNKKYRYKIIGRRFSDLQKYNLFQNINIAINNLSYHFNKWETIINIKYVININFSTEIWYVSAVNIKLIDYLDKQHMFVFANNYIEVDQIISPIIRKIILIYKEKYEKILPIIINNDVNNIPTVTWLANQGTIKSTIFKFLDTGIKISEEHSLVPMLEINKSTSFSISIKWYKNSYTEWIYLLNDKYPELKVTEHNDIIELRLIISFPVYAIPTQVINKKIA